MNRPADLLAFVAALIGGVGVMLAAASAHTGGGDLGKLASEFLIVHAAALIGVAANARPSTSRRANRLLAAGLALGAGIILFSGDLASRAYLGDRLFPFAAPVGGSLIILSWFTLAVVFALPE